MMQLPFEKNALSYFKEMEQYSHRLFNITDTLLKQQKVDIATAAKELVFQEDIVSLYHFKSPRAIRCPVPLLINYALVNRETMMDLEEGKSLIRNLLTLGIDIYMIVWGYPSRAERYVTMDDYIDMYIDDCVEYIRSEKSVERVNLMGVCQGGTFAAIYAALYPEKVRNLITMVAPIDFHTDDGLLNIWARYLDADVMVDALGNISGDLMNLVFLMLKPYQLMMDKYVGLLESAENPAIIENFLRMEKWIFDSPDQAGEAFRKFVNELYKKNNLIKGQLNIGGRMVDLKKIDMPVLNIFAEHDHLVPPCSSKAFEQYTSSKDFTNKCFPVGHIGVYVSSKTQKDLAPLIANWLIDRNPKTPNKVRMRAKAGMGKELRST
ncbi:MAG: class III poly(R)-hydroxyalkanoic acid synthase subunit PhaC, partial [Desulfobacteraceae bacterium]|nr:class III poly(R)-hydroxyalkanoic acid synthase subunit PhaC [Desulfobacteraceae bacterium]